jgi:hypothetical protein
VTDEPKRGEREWKALLAKLPDRALDAIADEDVALICALAEEHDLPFDDDADKSR